MFLRHNYFLEAYPSFLINFYMGLPNGLRHRPRRGYLPMGGRGLCGSRNNAKSEK